MQCEKQAELQTGHAAIAGAGAGKKHWQRYWAQYRGKRKFDVVAPFRVEIGRNVHQKRNVTQLTQVATDWNIYIKR